MLPEALLYKGLALWRLGAVEEALAALERARDRAEHLESRHVLWQLCAVAAEIAGERGEAARAEGLRDEARRIVAAIADNVAAPELRASFLRRPAVQKLLSG
jgi:ATP/maltotriose-dependent transcriptional regulator MalT